MRLARLVENGSLWLSATADDKINAETISAEAAKSFIPSPKDKEWLSLFALETDGDAEVIAAALRYNEGEISACHFVSVEIEQFASAGLEIKQTSGDTYHPDVNAKHYELHIPNNGSLNKVLELFSNGYYHRVEQPVVLSTLGMTAQNDNIDLQAVIQKPKINGSVATRTLELVRSEHLILKSTNAT